MKVDSKIDVCFCRIDIGFLVVPFAVGIVENVSLGDFVVVETEVGEVLAYVLKGPVSINPDELGIPVEEIQPILRIATDEDIRRHNENLLLEGEAFKFCKERIKHHNLPMKLLRVKSSLDRKRIMFFFCSETRVDFRALVRDLARKYRTRIEMRQIGVRDGAKMVGGLGPCGQEICCRRFLNKFESISVRMAKDQYLMLNPSKISGLCGRLMCCLSFELDVYLDLAKDFPEVGEKVKTLQGIEGEVVSANIIDRTVIISIGERKGQMVVSVDEIIREAKT
ncbi:MAG: PSP1 domain-containing protein [Thermosulfidibacteraceae bacterium]|jgi:cell fate regulator YaaT (PSP1 superfamily)